MLVEKLELWEGLFPLKKEDSKLFKHLLVAFWRAIAHYIHQDLRTAHGKRTTEKPVRWAGSPT